MARVDEVADGIYRISTLEPETEFQFNQFLIDDERPALIHTGMFPMYEDVRRAVAEVLDPASLAYVVCPHFEADECGGMGRLEVAVFLGLGSIPASLLGVWTLEWIKGAFDPEAVRNIMITIIAATLVLVGASLIFKAFLPERWVRRSQQKSGWDGKTSMSLKRRLFTVLFGATGGYLVGLTSIGSGSVMAVILLLLYPLAPAIVVGTDIAHATVLSLVTGSAHLLNGNVDLPLVGTLLLGSIPGVLVGSRLAPRLPGRPLTIILAVMLVFVGARLLLS